MSSPSIHDGPFHSIVAVVLRDQTGFPAHCEVRHGKQNCKWHSGSG